MITGTQIRAARAAIGLSAEKLAELADVAAKTIRRIEVVDDVPSSSAKTMARIQTVLEDAGIEFIGTPEDGPGIRIHKPQGS